MAKQYPIVQAIELALEKEGLKLIILLRLSPLVPFDILNYLMGVTSISFKHYALGSLGMIPGTIVYVYIGTGLSNMADVMSGNSSSGGTGTLAIVMLIVGSILACGGIIWISFVARQFIFQKLYL